MAPYRDPDKMPATQTPARRNVTRVHLCICIILCTLLVSVWIGASLAYRSLVVTQVVTRVERVPCNCNCPTIPTCVTRTGIQQFSYPDFGPPFLCPGGTVTVVRLDDDKIGTTCTCPPGAR